LLTLSQASGYASEDLDASSQEETTNKKRKLSKAAEAKLKANGKGKGKGKAKKKGKKGSDDEYEDEDDVYTALSKSMWSNASAKPADGSFENCAKCDQQFTVVSKHSSSNRCINYSSSLF